MANEVFDMTLEGIQDLQKELDERKGTISLEIAERLKEARSQGDLSENSEYDDAKEAQANNEFRIAEIEKILKNARVIDESEISNKEVTLGSKVLIKDVAVGEEEEYVLVSAREEDIFSGKISNESPVGSAILGKKKGELVHVKTPMGTMDYKIIKIGRP